LIAFVDMARGIYHIHKIPVSRSSQPTAWFGNIRANTDYCGNTGVREMHINLEPQETINHNNK